MRGETTRQAQILLAVTPEAFVPDDHPLRRIKPLVDGVLARLSPRFDAMYARRGRPSIPPGHLLKASLLIGLFCVRSERQFCEDLRDNLLFKWFLDLNLDDAPFNATPFSKNRGGGAGDAGAQRARAGHAGGGPGARRGIPATGGACGSASGWRRASAG